jgi:hypothetical protein
MQGIIVGMNIVVWLLSIGWVINKMYNNDC